MKLLPIALLSLLLLPVVFADEKPKDEKKPAMVVAADGFPAGNTTPEGAACDLARAFIEADAKLFRKTCIPPFGGGENRRAYEDFLKNVAASMEAEAKKDTPSPGGPNPLAKLFTARHLSMNGPASAGYAMYDFRDIMFVDVGVELVSGRKSLNRTLVIKKEDGTWYVHPAPHTASLLSVGLNDEDASTIDFKEAYTIEKPKSEQDGADQSQPATAVDSKAEGKESPELESEGRSK